MSPSFLLEKVWVEKESCTTRGNYLCIILSTVLELLRDCVMGGPSGQEFWVISESCLSFS